MSNAQHTPEWHRAVQEKIELKRLNAELLAALETLTALVPDIARQLPYGVPMLISDAHDTACAAIAKAKGQR
jgi:hypothetical protein